MVRSLRYGPQDRPQFARIIGIAATIALHVAALLLLLIPMTAPRSKVEVESPPEPRWVIPKIVPTPPMPIKQAQPLPRPAQPQTPINRPLPPAVPVATADSAPFVEPTPAVEAAQPNTETTPVIAPISGPVALSSLAYLSASAPRYPSAEARAGIEGTVTLRVLVGVDGVPLDVSIERSSGNRNLDKAALRHVKDTWRFQPAVRGGQPVQAYGLVPIDFTMQ